jgi:hypothetical protein
VRAVIAKPPKMAPKYGYVRFTLNENKIRAIYITTDPVMNATTTEIRMPEIIASALSVLMYWLSEASEPPLLKIFTEATATAEPNSSKTSETVVEVGRPKVLKRSRRIMSVSITAINMIMISEKKNSLG